VAAIVRRSLARWRENPSTLPKDRSRQISKFTGGSRAIADFPEGIPFARIFKLESEICYMLPPKEMRRQMADPRGGNVGIARKWRTGRGARNRTESRIRGFRNPRNPGNGFRGGGAVGSTFSRADFSKTPFGEPIAQTSQTRI